MSREKQETATDLGLETGRTNPRRRFLTLVHGGGAGPVTRELRGERLVLGREPGRGGFELADDRASRAHAELEHIPELGVYRVRDRGSKNGTFLNGQRLDDAEYLPDGSVLRIGGSLLVYSEMPASAAAADVTLVPGESPVMALCARLADLAAPIEDPILLVGPSGAGKEVLAQRIHARSGREGRLVGVNCSTFGRELLASELFGHVRGAFSGAQGARAGLFVSAAGGTLFLDEVADLPLDQQPALLRALQERRVRPVGSDREVTIDARVLAATHRDLETMVAEGAFRGDLFARLSFVVVRVPGLRERREEILPLFLHFVGETRRPLDVGAAEALLLYDWPYNVRELQQAAGAVRLYAPAIDVIDRALLPTAVQRQAGRRGDAGDALPDRDALIALLRANDLNVTAVARALDKTRQQVYRLLESRGIDLDALRR